MAITIDQRRHEALANRDAIRYFRYCNALGVEPEAPELYELGQIESSELSLEAMVKKLPTPTVDNSQTRTRRSRFDYARFREEVESNGYYNALNPAVNIDAKVALLKKYGIRNLWVGKGERIPIEDARGTRVGAVFKDYYERSLRGA